MKKITPADFPFERRMEDMGPARLKARISKALDWPMGPIATIPYLGGVVEVITYRYPELTAVCPVTGLPDFYDIRIVYTPGRLLPELKSLRHYLLGYRDLPITHEHLAAKVYRELKAQIKPRKLRIELSVSIRGGIKTDLAIG